MQSEPAAETITVTVKVPFVGDRTLLTNINETVKDLIEKVIATCQRSSIPSTQHCIVQSGRILSENDTLQQAGVTNGSVLHLMPRTRDSNSAPGRARSSRTRTNRNDTNDPSNSGDVSDAPNDDDDDHDDNEHHHHHDGEHHVHTNVIIGHVAVDGRIQYRDAHDMLLSVLHAIGFSTRAVRAAAAVAAAVATAMQSSEERAAASRTVLQTAWQGTRSLQEQFERERNTTPIHAERITNETPNETATEDTPSTSTQPTSRDTASSSHAKENSSQSEQPRDTDASAARDNIATSSPSLEAYRPEATSELLPEDPPPIGDGESVLQASERAADRLLPVVADFMETAASRIRNGPSVVNLEGSDRLDAVQRLTEDLGSVAGVVTIVTTLISTLLPDPDDLRTSNASNRRTQGSDHRPQGAGSASGNDGSNSAAQNEGANPSRGDGQQQGQSENRGLNGASGASRSQSVSNGGNGSNSGSRSFNLFPFGPPSEQSQGERNEAQARSNRRVRRSRRVRVSSSQAANADFIIRVLSYYFCSLSDVQSIEGSGPPEVDGQTAVSVLDGLYGRNNTARPTNVFLKVAHSAMQNLTPRQFHEILQGNMLPLGAIRAELWEEISRAICANNEEVLTEEVEEVLVDDICEILHEFVHILESADDANEDGVFTPGPEDFCHHIMHTIQAKMEGLAQILARSESEQVFSRRMSHWIKGAVGEILYAISSELEMQWDGLLISFRRAVYEIGKTVVGSQFSVIFPYIANLLANRAKQAYQAVASRHPSGQQSGERGSVCINTDGDENYSNCDPNCGPSCEGLMMELQGDAGTQDDSDLDLDGDSYKETDSDMPELHEAASDDDDSSDCSDDEMADADEERDESTAREIGIVKDVSYDLNNAELRDLAKELATEAMPAEINHKSDGVLDESDFKAMASELIAEDASSFGKSIPGSSSSQPGGIPRENVTMAPGANMNPILSASRSIPSSSAGRATFSSAAVSRGGSSTLAQKNDFKGILGPQFGDRWQRVVDRDEIRVRERTYGPLSRAYSGANSIVSPLDTKRGAELAAEAAREAAKRAKLSPERAKELERVASESGSEYTKEVERAIGSRLRSDPDFDEQSFPRAAKRFLSRESSA